MCTKHSILLLPPTRVSLLKRHKYTNAQRKGELRGRSNKKRSERMELAQVLGIVVAGDNGDIVIWCLPVRYRAQSVNKVIRKASRVKYPILLPSISFSSLLTECIAPCAHCRICSPVWCVCVCVSILCVRLMRITALSHCLVILLWVWTLLNTVTTRYLWSGFLHSHANTRRQRRMSCYSSLFARANASIIHDFIRKD